MYTQDEIMNKHLFYRNGELFCDDVPVTEIIREMGTPLYIYSKAILEEKYNAIARAFSDIDTTICFAVKSCSSMPVLRVLYDLGSGFDIVSGGELFRIVNCCGDTSKVVFSGVGKTDKEIKYALEKGVLLFNIESEAELSNINLIAGQMNVKAPVGLRINPDVDPRTHKKTTTGKKENKFGIDFSTASKIIENLSSYPNITLKAFSMHIGSPVYSTQPYADALDKILEFIDSRSGLPDSIEYIDCGGGFGLLYNDEAVPDFTDYADVIVPGVKKSGLKLILEPGRPIAGNAGVLIASVLYRKSNPRKNFVITDAGMHSLVRPAMYGSYHGIWLVK
ncbi:diaminopimelate decarboxylase, partial [bacterium]|nr:diaminopimelate decarboxylase [bacterium]MBU1025937.1 diaminopimelate decarboxylase [bacterium]